MRIVIFSRISFFQQQKMMIFLLLYQENNMGHDARKPVFGVSEQSDQPLCSLIRKYHIYTCYKLNIIFELVSIAEEARFSITLSETQKTGFVASRPICCDAIRKPLSEPAHEILALITKTSQSECGHYLMSRSI